MQIIILKISFYLTFKEQFKINLFLLFLFIFYCPVCKYPESIFSNSKIFFSTFPFLIFNLFKISSLWTTSFFNLSINSFNSLISFFSKSLSILLLLLISSSLIFSLLFNLFSNSVSSITLSLLSIFWFWISKDSLKNFGLNLLLTNVLFIIGIGPSLGNLLYGSSNLLFNILSNKQIACKFLFFFHSILFVIWHNFLHQFFTLSWSCLFKDGVFFSMSFFFVFFIFLFYFFDLIKLLYDFYLFYLLLSL